MKKYGLALLFSFFLLNCSQPAAETKTKPTTTPTAVLKIFIDSTGVINADGKTVSLEELDKKANELKTKVGMIYYSRDNSLKDPPKEAEKVIEIIAKYNLPIKFFTAKTFSETVEFK